jgi:hypothetical protein
MNQAPRTLSYNPAENAVLLTSDVDGGSYELYKIPKDARGDSAPVSSVFLSLGLCLFVGSGWVGWLRLRLQCGAGRGRGVGWGGGCYGQYHIPKDARGDSAPVRSAAVLFSCVQMLHWLVCQAKPHR